MKSFKYWAVCTFAFIFWKAFFSTDIAKDTLQKIVAPAESSQYPPVNSLEYLAEVAEETNKSLPKKNDNGTIFEYVKAEKGRLIYQYRLSLTDTSTHDTSEFKGNMKLLMTEQACYDDWSVWFMKKNVALVFEYFDKNGIFVGSATIHKNDC